MSQRELHLLSPYRLPTTYPLQLANDEASAWMNGHAALWHPAALAMATKIPQVSNSYDHDSPVEGYLYAVPQGPSLFQPDDWPSRVAAVNAIPFAATEDRVETVRNLLDALREKSLGGAHLDLPDDVVRQFQGVGFGYLLLESLYDAMEHERLLDVSAFWSDVSGAADAAGDPERQEEMAGRLRAAAEQLQMAREQLYSGSMYWLDWCIPDAANLGADWPTSLEKNVPITVLASAELLERLAAEAPSRFEQLKAKCQPDSPGRVDLCCGAYREREDALLPVESQWWNLRKARTAAQALLGVEPTVYARTKSAYHPQLPAWLQQVGFKHAVMISFDGALLPSLRTTAINWPAPDGKAIDAFIREPLPANDPHTFFNLVYHIHQSTSQDPTPTIAIVHKGKPAYGAYHDLLALAAIAPVFGDWVGLGRYFQDAFSGEYVGPQNADDFFADYLDDRVTTGKRPDAVSGFPRHARLRRRVDGAFALAALHRSLTPGAPGDDESKSLQELAALEDEIELRGVNFGSEAAYDSNAPDDFSSDVVKGEPKKIVPVDSASRATDTRLAAVESAIACRLADRVQIRSTPNTPGFMVFNPCNFTRRTALEIEGFRSPIAVEGPVKAAEFAGSMGKLVVEVPSLGFAWVPLAGPRGTAAPKAKMKYAEGMVVRNEFFEADIDPATGGLRAFRDLRTRTNRFGQYLVYNPGSKIKVDSVAVTHVGPALGEITSDGMILNEQDEPLARFRQRFRAWAGRPVLELKIDIEATHAPTGYPWHSYYGSRFGWRDERAVLFRGVNGANTQTGYTRPVSADYLEVRLGSERSFLFTGGLPFLQRHGSRMADVILVPEGERETSFELLLSLDREQPMQTAAGWVSPSPVVMTNRGPPHIGPTGWLAHVDMPSLILTSLRPTEPGDGMDRAVVAQFAECAGFGGTSEFRFARDPSKASIVDGMNIVGQELVMNGDAITLDYSASEILRVKAEWAKPPGEVLP